MKIKNLSETSQTKLLGIGFDLENDIDFVGDGHGNVLGFYNDAPIHYAAREGDLDLLRDLWSKGADINILCGTSNWTPIMWAALYGRKDVVDFLIQKGADLTLKAPHTEYIDKGPMKVETILTPCNKKGKYPDHSGYDLKDVISEKNTLKNICWPTTFFWTQCQKYLLHKQVDYSGTEALIDNALKV